MIVPIVLLVLFVVIVVWANIPEPKQGMQYWDVISFNPFVNPSECPVACKMVSLDSTDATPSILMDSMPDKSRCSYQQDTIVYPCPTKCCA